MYKIVFISNFLSPHQIPICECFHKKYGNKFLFVATKEINQERLKLGYKNHNQEEYVLRSYENEVKMQEAKNIAENAEVVIIGSAPDSFIIGRLKKKKLTFKYTERLLKNKLSILRLPRYMFGTWLHHGRFMKYPLYLLCSGGYVSNDLNRLGYYKNRCFKWGYFPETKEYNIRKLLEKKEINSIIWVGRYLDWKHPEYVIEVAKRLKQDGIKFKIRMIGTGDLEKNIKNEVNNNNMNDVVEILGAMSPEKVREYMEKSEIHLFTSNRYEGWGAVLNESMNSGCIPIVSNMIGASPFLIKDGENGYIYQESDIDDLYYKVKELLKSKTRNLEIGKNAYETIHNIWNADEASNRFIDLIDIIKYNKKNPYNDGPCSIAQRIRDKKD